MRFSPNNPIRIFTLCSVLFACALGSTASFAQTPTPPPPPPLKLRFIFLDENTGEYSLRINDNQPVPLVSASFALSAPFAIPPKAKLRIYRASAAQVANQSKTPSAPSRPASPVIATLRPDDSLTSALVVLSPREPSSAPAAPPVPGATEPEPMNYTAQWIDDAPEKHPDGSLRIINLIPAPLAAQIAGEAHQVDAGKTLVLQPTWDERRRVRSRVAVKQVDGWKMIYDSITSCRPNERITALVIFSAEGMRFTYTDHEIATFGAPPPSALWLTYTDTR
jgi:hypothetical protein